MRGLNDEKDDRCLPRRLIPLLSAASFLLAAMLALGACVPLDWLRPIGTLVRRPDDVTPERFYRYVHVCGFFACAFAVLGALLVRFRGIAAEYLQQLDSECRDVVGSFRTLRPPSIYIIFVVTSAILLRLHYLHVPMAYDEAYSFLNFARRPWYEAVADYNNTNNHILNTFLMHWCFRLFGQQDWALRLPALFAGITLTVLAYPWTRARFDPVPALLAATFIGTSLVMVDYSVNARGYMFVTLAAVTTDWCLERIDAGAPKSALNWFTAWSAIVLGCWAIPIMVYPATGLIGWFGLAPLTSTSENRKALTAARVRSTCVLIGCSVLAVAALYAPAYIFRGLTATRNPFVHSIGFHDWLAQTPAAWSSAFERWTFGTIPAEVWMITIACGVLALMRTPRVLVRLAMVFLSTALLMAAHRVAPPPRVFVFLTPWVLLLSAIGWSTVLSWISRSPWLGRAFALGAIAVAGAFAARHAVIVDPEQRAKPLLSLPTAIAYVAEQQSSGDSRLLAPLPCDLPAIYYLRQRALPIPVNGKPVAGERLWLLAKPGELPATTLTDVVVGLGDVAAQMGPWNADVQFPHLEVWQTEYTEP